MKKGIVISFSTAAYDNFQSGKIGFHEKYTIAAEQRMVKEDRVLIRVEADWLPEWAETEEGGKFPEVALVVDENGWITEITK